MKVLAVTSEFYPLVKTGGLADVAGALPPALAALGVEVKTILPAYRTVKERIGEPEMRVDLGELYGGPAQCWAVRIASGADVLLLDAPHLFDRAGGPYADAGGQDWPDNPVRFAALSRSAVRVAEGLIPEWRPDIVHAHDWQAGLTPAYLALAGGRHPRTVMTIHNLAFQGQCGPELLGYLGLPPAAFAVNGVEYYGGIGFLKAGIYYADHVTTVSPSYAREIQTTAAGMGLDGLLASRAGEGALSGILNGIDVETWDPENDPHLPAPYSVRNLDAKALNKRALQERLGLETDPARPLFGVISRLTWQKGMDVLVEAVPALVARGGQLALLGAGDDFIENRLRAMAAADPLAIGCVFGFDEPLAHLIQGGADFLLVPSRFEPCGLTQLYALRYGTIPVVARLGGLADTVIDANEAALQAGVATGIQFAPIDVAGLSRAIHLALTLYDDPETWSAMQRCGMTSALSWQRPAAQYRALYHRLLEGAH